MKKFILKKLSVLFVLSISVLVLCLKFIVFDYFTIDNDFGMAGIGLIMFLGAALSALLLDYILSRFIKNRVALNIIELLIVLYVYLYFNGYKLLHY